MAFYIKIRKNSEDERVVKYSFESDGGTGAFQIDKLNGDITLLTEIPGDEKGLFFSRAAAKIRNEWKEGRLPDKTEWAS